MVQPPDQRVTVKDAMMLVFILIFGGQWEKVFSVRNNKRCPSAVNGPACESSARASGMSSGTYAGRLKPTPSATSTSR